MNINIELLKKIKFFLIFTLISVIFLGSSIFFYKQLDINIENLKITSEKLENEVKKSKKKQEETFKIAQESNSFLRQNNHLYFFNVEDELDYFSKKEIFLNKIKTIHPNLELELPLKFQNTKTYLKYYDTKIKFKYTNPYYLNNLIYYFENNVFHEFKKLNYDTNKKEFILNLNIFSNSDLDKNGIKFNNEGRR